MSDGRREYDLYLLNEDTYHAILFGPDGGAEIDYYIPTDDIHHFFEQIEQTGYTLRGACSD